MNLKNIAWLNLNNIKKFFLNILIFKLILKQIILEQALPDVIKFIEQFPEYLKIISHCTRKSEVAVWSHLFSVVGDSRKLFEVLNWQIIITLQKLIEEYYDCLEMLKPERPGNSWFLSGRVTKHRKS